MSFCKLTPRLIQATAGGLLINIKGEVIGINTAIFTNVQGNYMAQGIGFASPVSLSCALCMTCSYMERFGEAGLESWIQEVTRKIADSLNLPDAREVRWCPILSLTDQLRRPESFEEMWC